VGIYITFVVGFEVGPHELVNLASRREYDEVKRDLVRKMWRFAAETDDHIFNPYATVAFAPWGPADAFHAET
jgi:hypothetical protein